MAITRLFQTGFETGTDEEFGGASSLFAQSTTKFTGGWGARDKYQADNAIQPVPATRQIRVGWWMNPTEFWETSVRFSIRDVSNNELIGMEWQASSKDVTLRVATVEQDVSNGMNSYGWHHIAIDVKVDSSSGWATVYRDGIEVMTFSGNTGNADITQVIFGRQSGGGNSEAYWDDIYIDDTTGEGSAAVCPILRFYYVTPDGNGNYSDWLGSDADSTDNYLLVDEVPPDTADYLESTALDDFDSFTMSTFTLDTGQQIDAVIPIVQCKRDDTTEEIAVGTRYSSTDVIGSDQTPGAVSDHLYERQTTKPGGGAWDQTSLDGFEVVVKSRGTY